MANLTEQDIALGTARAYQQALADEFNSIGEGALDKLELEDRLKIKENFDRRYKFQLEADPDSTPTMRRSLMDSMLRMSRSEPFNPEITVGEVGRTIGDSLLAIPSAALTFGGAGLGGMREGLLGEPEEEDFFTRSQEAVAGSVVESVEGAKALVANRKATNEILNDLKETIHNNELTPEYLEETSLALAMASSEMNGESEDLYFQDPKSNLSSKENADLLFAYSISPSARTWKELVDNVTLSKKNIEAKELKQQAIEEQGGVLGGALELGSDPLEALATIVELGSGVGIGEKVARKQLSKIAKVATKTGVGGAAGAGVEALQETLQMHLQDPNLLDEDFKHGLKLAFLTGGGISGATSFVSSFKKERDSISDEKVKDQPEQVDEVKPEQEEIQPIPDEEPKQDVTIEDVREIGEITDEDTDVAQEPETEEVSTDEQAELQAELEAEQVAIEEEIEADALEAPELTAEEVNIQEQADIDADIQTQEEVETVDAKEQAEAEKGQSQLERDVAKHLKKTQSLSVQDMPAKYSKSVPQQKLFREEARKQKAELKEVEKTEKDKAKREQRNRFTIEKLDQEGKDFIDLTDKELDFLADEANPDTNVRDKARAAIEEIALAPDESDRLVNQIKANKIKLVTPAQAKKLGLAEAGEIAALAEELPKSFFRKDGLNLDQAAEQLRELGFNAETGNDAVNLINDDLRASRARGVYPTFEDKLIDNPAVQEASERILGRVSKGLLPGAKGGIISNEMLTDLGIVGAELVKIGVNKFSDWSKDMIRRFGVGIKNALNKVWNNGSPETFKPSKKDEVEVSDSAKEASERILGRVSLAVQEDGKQTPDPDGLDPVRDKEIVEVKPNDKKSSLRVSNIFQPMGKFTKKYLTSKGNMPDVAFSAMLRKQGRVGQATVKAKQLIKKYENAVGKLPKEMQKGIHARVNEVMSGNADSTIIPESIRDIVMEMRRTIDSMSNDLIKNGAVYGDLKDKVEGNIGHYLHRSYRKFDDPNWAKKVPEQVKNDAYNFMAQRMRAQMIQELSDRKYLEQNPDVKNVTSEVRETLEWAQIAQSMIDNKSLQPEHADVQGMIEWVLSKDAGGMESFIKAPSKQGSKDLRIFKQRKEIPKPIRALMGEYTDARINFFQSFVKMATLESAHLFQQEFRQAGMGRFLFESPKAGFATQIASENSKIMSPLNISEVDENGRIIQKPVFTSPEIADAMKHAMEPGSLDGVAGWIYSKWMMLNGITKMSKTVLSVPTQALNFWSNFTFMVANGHYDIREANKTFKTLHSQWTSKGDKESQALVQRLTKLGVFGTTVNVNEIQDIFKRAGLEQNDIAEFTDSLVKKTIKAPVNVALKMYQAGDEFFKAFAFLNEHDRWSKIRPDLSSSQIDEIVADRIRNTLPSYDMVPRLIQNIRKTGLIGTFVSFPAEAIRTAFHTIRYALQDIRSDNKLQRREGYRRLVGIGFAAGFTKGIQMTSMAMSGITEDEDKELRHHQPEWNENSDFMYLPQERQGEYRMIDVTRWNPHGLEVKIANAILSGEDPIDALQGGMKELIEPFGTLTIQTDAAIKILELMRSDEFQVQSPINQTSEIADIIWKAYGPSTLTQLQKVYLASEQLDIKESDRALNLKDEMTAFLGTRPVSRNIKKSMMFKGFAYQKSRRNISSEYRNLTRQPGASQSSIDKAYDRQEALRRELFDEMVDRVNGAIRYLGVTKAQVRDRLKNDANMSKRDIDDLFNNTYTPLKRRGFDKKK